MKINEYNGAMKWITRPKAEATIKKAVNPEGKKMPILDYIKKINSLYSNYDESEDPRYVPPAEIEDIKKSLPVSELVKEEERFNDKILKRDKYAPKKKIIKVAGIKDSALFKLLSDPKVLGVELGHETILEIINLIQHSGLVKKPEEKYLKIVDPEWNDELVG